ncbi:M50 family metallopeptidase [Gayadomonas joobiniege]|uniref:M50 family metallopeptidase n=1 Tax=Gayadomonas joobiniege TaxID=1234606 RepID=UPI000371CF5F|nr:M50 family metallopeptidase [Gayadomonas joobiniege]
MQLTRRTLFFIALVSVLLLQQIPWLMLPLKWFETYFHEVSHALVTLLTGGSVVNISLNIDGSGLCLSQGGSQFLIALSGYLGACGFAVLFAKLALKAKQWVLHLLTVLIFLTLLFWVSDLISVLIIGLILAVLYFTNRYLTAPWRRFIMLALAINMALNAIKSPFYLLASNTKGDATALANLTLIHEYIWIFFWISVGLYSLYWIGRGLYAKG